MCAAVAEPDDGCRVLHHFVERIVVPLDVVEKRQHHEVASVFLAHQVVQIVERVDTRFLGKRFDTHFRCWFVVTVSDQRKELTQHHLHKTGKAIEMRSAVGGIGFTENGSLHFGLAELRRKFGTDQSSLCKRDVRRSLLERVIAREANQHAKRAIRNLGRHVGTLGSGRVSADQHFAPLVWCRCKLQQQICDLRAELERHTSHPVEFLQHPFAVFPRSTEFGNLKQADLRRLAQCCCDTKQFVFRGKRAGHRNAVAGGVAECA